MSDKIKSIGEFQKGFVHPVTEEEQFRPLTPFESKLIEILKSAEKWSLSSCGHENYITTDQNLAAKRISKFLDEQDEGWVPVAKELPDRLRPVLIYEPGPNVNDYTIAVSFWDGTYSKDKRKMPQFPDGQDDQPGYYWPSHWRPLPAPPATT